MENDRTENNHSLNMALRRGPLPTKIFYTFTYAQKKFP
jgi:hypothetical protein